MGIEDTTDWWHYFEKIDDGKFAKCKHCEWKKPRGKTKSTYMLRYHLEHEHKQLYNQKIEAERKKTKAEEERKRKGPKIQNYLDVQTKEAGEKHAKLDVNANPKKYPIFGIC
jgi:hypothetical protein